jgi:hypothetical protein
VRTAAVIAVVWGAQLLACGGGPAKCANASCSVPGTTVVKWEFDNEPTLMFPDDSCGDLGAVTVHVVATNPDDGSDGSAQDTPCDNGQATFVGLDPGTYTMAVTPEDSSGAPLIGSAATAMIEAAPDNGNESITVEVPYTSWINAYTGTFLFRLTWGGQSCPAPVTTQLLTMTTSDGKLVTALDDGNHKLDGTDPEPCRASTDQFPEFVDGLPFGPATLAVVGEDGSGSAVFASTFETFVGAGKSNPTLTFDLEMGSGSDGSDGSGSGSGS